MIKPLLFILTLVVLTSCGQQTVVVPTQTPLPTVVSPTAIPTSTFIPVAMIPTATPTRPGETLIKPDETQVTRWKEYQTALAKNVLTHLPPEEVLCEWDILGQSGNDVYVWIVCKGNLSSGSLPAIIHLDSEGAVLSVERASNWSRDIPRLFPPDVIDKFAHYHSGRAGELIEHIEWRRTHPDEPPLIILLATSTP